MVVRQTQAVGLDRLWTIPLADARARDAALVGSKAARLATAWAAGLPVLEGSVLTVEGARRFVRRNLATHAELRQIWAEMPSPLVARSSSPVEDLEASSMAGMFDSFLNLTTWDDFIDAVERVIASAKGAPMAVLIQPHLETAHGGVMFGLDPVSGRRDRIVIAAAAGGPDALVSGREGGSRTIVTRGGRRIESTGDGPRPGHLECRRLAVLARLVEETFGAPQDVEWALGREGKLWLLQSRPITAAPPAPTASGPVYGPGPIAETFPNALSPLELDLWVRPLKDALRIVLPLIGAATSKVVEESPLVIDVDGRVALDMAAIGALPRRGFLARVDPRPAIRRLLASWRVGRLRAALPALSHDVIATVDSDLARVPRLDALSDRRLLDVLANTTAVLVAIHAHELMAALLAEKEGGRSGAGRSLADLAAGRREGLGDSEIASRYPSTLMLVPPRVGGAIRFGHLGDVASEQTLIGQVDAREELRLRVRLVQELSARVALELGRRMSSRGALADPESIRGARLEELEALLDGDVVLLSLEDRPPIADRAPLPALFRLSSEGIPVEVQDKRHRAATTGVSGGYVEGIAFDGTGPVPADGILVVRNLDPALAPLLPRVAGIVAETGSVLSHLAILAREFAVPTAVGVPDAVARFTPGTRLSVDGSSGEVAVLGGSS